MRFIVYVSICLLLFSNIASAAMSCCVDLDLSTLTNIEINNSQVHKQTKSFPCHEAVSDSIEGHENRAVHECDCEACAQFLTIFDQKSISPALASSMHRVLKEHIASSAPDSIYHPPKRYS